ncbi:MAG: HAD family phosphatase [Candidatus Protochlamydia sp.]|nr:HAD family phosphatase [Candidatus Protochlamydia sp.]
MNWIHNFQLFLFDFDGLLVDTETLHFKAYQRMCSKRGADLNWSFSRYSEAAHHHATGLRDSIYAEFPSLFTQEPDWDVLYKEKKQALLDLVMEGQCELMPGAANLLASLEKSDIKRCVVTNSPLQLIEIIRRQNPILNTIPNWITREDYDHPKPHPECYQVAIDRHAIKGDKVIGFEDSPRGLKALLQTPAKPVLVCPPDSPYLKHLLTPELAYYSSLNTISENDHP